MPDILVDDLDDRTLDALRKRAQARNRPLEAEVRAILEEIATEEDRRGRGLPPNLAALQAELARRPSSSDSTDIVRAMRDGR